MAQFSRRPICKADSSMEFSPDASPLKIYEQCFGQPPPASLVPRLTGSSLEDLVAQEELRMGVVPVGAKPASVTFWDNLALGFARTTEKRQAILQRSFRNVQPLPDGNFMVGNQPDHMLPLRAQGLFNGLGGRLVRLAGDPAGMVGAIGLVCVGLGVLVWCGYLGYWLVKFIMWAVRTLKTQ